MEVGQIRAHRRAQIDLPCSTRRITAVVVTVFEMDASGKTVQTGDRQPLVHVGDAEAANGRVAVLEDAERDTGHVIGGHFEVTSAASDSKTGSGDACACGAGARSSSAHTMAVGMASRAVVTMRRL